jgi:hypothetical protein
MSNKKQLGGTPLQKLELTWIGNCLKQDSQDLRINKI